MKIPVDTHTHSIASGHSFSTVQEMAYSARKNGIKMFALTDHGIGMPGGPHVYHFGNLKAIPPKISGVRILKGAESNIMDFNGTIDIPAEKLKNLDFVLAGFHDICLMPGSREDHTLALIRVLENPLIDAISHPGNPQYPIDIDRVVRAARDNRKMLEINNSSFTVRTGSSENCYAIARKCMEQGVRMVCGSDAHISFDIGNFDNIRKLFKEVGMPEELVLNTSVKKFEAYLEEKKERIESAS